MAGVRDKFKGEDDEVDAPFRALEKSKVLQECRKFHDQTFTKRHPKRCCQLITKLLVLLTHGEVFSSTEVTDVFFGVTKLFESEDGNLRRMVYLFLKEVADATNPAELIIVVQSLCQDMNKSDSKSELYRANACRVLCRILDNDMLAQSERLYRQAIVDKNELVASSALVSGIQFYKMSPDVVRRWVSEVQNAVQSKYPMVQFHALVLLRNIKQTDRLAVSKLVTQLRRAHMGSPLALCMLIRYTADLIRHDPSDSEGIAVGYEFLDRCLRYNGAQSEMVNYEAARAICEWPTGSPGDMAPAITTLHIFMTSGKPTQRFVAARTLSKLALRHPLVVAKCNKELEMLIGDSNRTVATLAITTLLKTGGESSIDRLMKEIMTFMSEIGDEFKVVVVKAIHELCERYPQKYHTMFSFLLQALREEGGFDFKKSILVAMIDLINKIPESKSEGLLHLCEFIEDCEFASLSAWVLHFLGDVGPDTPSPGSYVRYIYNRVILECAQVRAAAVSALTKFAVRVEALQPNIVVLLKRCADDDDDEVRDRAAASLRLLTGGDMGPAKLVVSGRLPVGPRTLSRALREYQARPSPGEFSFDALPALEDEEVHVGQDTDESKSGAGAGAGGGAKATSVGGFAAELAAIPEFAELGTLFRSTATVPLTESELEYLVTCVRHIYPEYVVFQFNITNTVPDQLLENVYVGMQVSDPENWDDVAVIPAESCKCNESAVSYVCLKRTNPGHFASSTFNCSLYFKTTDIDPDSGEPVDDGYNDEYELEDMVLGPADFMRRLAVPNFRATWDELKAGAVVESFALDKSVEGAVNAVAAFLGMKLCDGTGTVPNNARNHSALLSGTFLGGVQVLARMQVISKGPSKCVLKIGVCATDPDVARIVANCIS